MSVREQPSSTVIIRELRGALELKDAETIQREVWGHDTIPESCELLQAMQDFGGLVAGAFEPTGRMIGFIWGFPTRDPGVQHSHRLAVIKDWRGQGVGARLKWFQYDWCHEHDIHLVQWTVDPLRAANADLNVRHLGASSATYWVDYYGEMHGIDSGVPSDRLLIDWHLDDHTVAPRRHHHPEDRGYPHAVEANRIEGGRPHDARPDLDDSQVLIHIPCDFVRLSAKDRAQAILWRLHTRELFQAYFQRGYRITGFTRSCGPAYMLERA
jgi:chorismate synthase